MYTKEEMYSFAKHCMKRKNTTMESMFYEWCGYSDKYFKKYSPTKNLSPKMLKYVSKICKYYKVDMELVFMDIRKRDLVKTRFFITYFFIENFKIDDSTLPACLNKDRTTIRHYKKQIYQLLKIDKQIQEDFKNLIEIVNKIK